MSVNDASKMEMQQGTCDYCGQSMTLQTVGELSQAELDAMVTDKCNCPEAKSARRKKERKERIDSFVKKHFDPEVGNLIYNVIPMVEQSDLTNFSVTLPDERTVKIWVDADAYLRIKIKKTSEEDLQV